MRLVGRLTFACFLALGSLTASVARAEASWQQVSQAMAPARLRVSELTRRLHDVQLEHSRLQQQAQQSGERAARIHQELAEIAAQSEE